MAATRRDLVFLLNYVLTNITETSQYEEFQHAFERIEEIIYLNKSTPTELQSLYKDFWNCVYDSKGALLENMDKLNALLRQC